MQPDASATTPPTGFARWFIVVLLVPIVLTTLAMAMGLAVVIILILTGMGGGPLAKPVFATLAVLLYVALFAFFLTITRRLIAYLRGRDVPHLFPPVVGLTVGGLVGLGATVVGIVCLWRHDYAPVGTLIGLGVLFLGYAGKCAREVFHVQRDTRHGDSATDGR